MPTIKIEELNNEDAQNHHHSQSDDEEPPIQEAELEESPIVPNPTRQAKKQQEYVACPHCKKSMLLKTFKYYHSYKCRPEAPQPTVAKQVASERIEVSFNEFQNKKDQRNDTIKRLISKAF